MRNPGCRNPQAETVVRQRVRLLEGNLATKADVTAINANIETLRQETNAQIAVANASVEKLRQETEKLIALCKVDIIKWVVGANLGIAAIVVAAKLL